MENIGTRWRVPKRNDDKEWAKLSKMFDLPKKYVETPDYIEPTVEQLYQSRTTPEEE